MVNKTFNINLDLKSPADAYGIEVVEGDNGNIFVITLTDDGTAVDLTGCKILAVFSLPDGQTVEQDTEGNGITVGGDNNNVVTIALRAGSFQPSESMACELQVYSGTNQSKLTTTAPFNFKCRRSIMNDNTIQSEEKYPILVGLISQVEEIAARTGDMTKAVYDTDNDGKVDEAENADDAAKLDGHSASYFAQATHATDHASDGADPITPAAIGAEKQRLQFADTAVTSESFVEDTTYTDFPYRAAVALTGVLATMTPEVVLGVAEAMSGSFAPVAACYDGGVYLYASNAPDAAITIPTIICWKAVE